MAKKKGLTQLINRNIHANVKHNDLIVIPIFMKSVKISGYKNTSTSHEICPFWLYCIFFKDSCRTMIKSEYLSTERHRNATCTGNPTISSTSQCTSLIDDMGMDIWNTRKPREWDYRYFDIKHTCVHDFWSPWWYFVLIKWARIIVN